jgi:hypothetical protein
MTGAWDKRTLEMQHTERRPSALTVVSPVTWSGGPPPGARAGPAHAAPDAHAVRFAAPVPGGER